MKILSLLILLLSGAVNAGTYLGFNGGYTGYSSDALEKFKVGPKGMTYGGFFGFGKGALGVEFIYQSLNAEGKIKHDGSKYTITENATAMGGAVRLSFNSFYLRAGLASYQLNQKVDIDNAASQATAEDVYDIQKKGSRQGGSLYGLGVHTKWGPSTVFLDLTRYQVGSVGHYDAVAVGLSFPISEKFFSLGN